MHRTVPGLTILALFLVGCSAASGSPTPTTHAATTMQPQVMQVDNVTAQVGAGMPAEVTLTVQGSFPDACTRIADVNQVRSGFSVQVMVTTTRPAGVACAQVVTPHIEIIRLGEFDTAGSYTVEVNGISTSFTVGEMPAPMAGSYDAQLVIPLQTMDGVVGLTAPLGWAVETGSGTIRIAVDEATLTPSEVATGASLTVIVATGPGRAQDFGLDGRTVNEVYAYFVATTGGRQGRPTELVGSPYPGLGGHGSDPRVGDSDLRILVLNEETMVAVFASSPAGEWAAFSPMVEAIVASLHVH